MRLHKSNVQFLSTTLRKQNVANRLCQSVTLDRRKQILAYTSRRLEGDVSRIINVHVEDETFLDVSTCHDTGCSVQDYIALPTSQYVLIDLPFGGVLDRIGSDVFQISVPKLELAGIWVKPIITCIVRNDAGFVDIRSTELQIETSNHMEFLKLAECVDFSVQCQLRPIVGDAQPKFHCSSQINAVVAPPDFFGYIPQFVLDSTAHVALKTSLSTLQSTFLRSLARDYERWATSSTYRDERQRHAEQSEQQLLQK